jgi:hypothetical protein
MANRHMGSGAKGNQRLRAARQRGYIELDMSVDASGVFQL